MSNSIPRSFGTHDGTFHADEVSACALLLVSDLIDKDKVKRTRNPEVLETCEYVCDVGGIYDPAKKRFDHHQADYKGELSSAGMILRYLKQIGKLSDQEFALLNESMIMGIDWHDNGVAGQLKGICTFSHVISGFVPVSYSASSEEQTAGFFKALDFSVHHIQTLLDRHRYNRSCRGEVEKKMAEYRDCLIFDEALAWMESFFDLDGERHPAKFVIMPTGEHWKLRGIPPSLEERMSVRQPLPESWAGLLEDELKKVSGIEGAIFCHKGRFISVWQNREDALKALELVIEQGKGS